jgi:hypothetical protein
MIATRRERWAALRRLAPILAAAAVAAVGCHDKAAVPWLDPCSPACVAGEACWAGACVPEAACVAPYAVCDFADQTAGCTDLRDDPYNCGGCGLQCLHGVCQGGVCRGAGHSCAEAGLAECVDAGGDSYCAYLGGDLLDCGACGTACDVAAGETCAAGVCQPAGTTCESLGLEACPLGCVDLLSDPFNCGQCGNACMFGCDGLGGCR